VIYSKSLIDELNLSYLEKSKEIKEGLTKSITSQGTFSLTLDA
jgi:hypothetical protein